LQTGGSFKCLQLATALIRNSPVAIIMEIITANADFEAGVRDGIVFVAQARALGIPVLAYTGIASDSTIKKLKNILGADRVSLKPQAYGDVIAKVADMLA